jgi:hypothetical protein
MMESELLLPDTIDQARGTPNTGVTDRRRHRRVPLSCLGRFMRRDKAEFPCKLLDISVGGAALISPHSVTVGEHVVVYFDELGRIDGPVVRKISGGFAMQIIATQHRREKLAAQLTWLINRRTLGIPEARRHNRIVPSNMETILMLPSGIPMEVKILDVSISGASISMVNGPPVGSDVFLGRLRARVTRHHEQGIAVNFTDIQNPAAIKRQFT